MCTDLNKLNAHPELLGIRIFCVGFKDAFGWDVWNWLPMRYLKSLHMSLDLPEMGLEEFREIKRGKKQSVTKLLPI